jgi:hypothetical protein
MQTRELVRLLLEQDPGEDGLGGSTHVSIGGQDIHFLSTEPAYWDGPRSELIRDPALEPYYSVTGVKIVHKGEKVEIYTMGVRDVLLNNQDAVVEIDEDPGNRLHEWVEGIRSEHRAMIVNVESDLFCQDLVSRVEEANHSAGVRDHAAPVTVAMVEPMARKMMIACPPLFQQDNNPGRPPFSHRAEVSIKDHRVVLVVRSQDNLRRLLIFISEGPNGLCIFSWSEELKFPLPILLSDLDTLDLAPYFKWLNPPTQ